MTNDDEQATIQVDQKQGEWKMLTAAEGTVQAMAAIMQTVPIGTNIGLLRVLWVMVNGSFLQSRGAVLSAFCAPLRTSTIALRSEKPVTSP